MNGRTCPARPGFRLPGLLCATMLAGLGALLLPAPGTALAEEGYAVVSVCLINSLDEPITYEYRWGTDSWSWDRLEVGSEIEHRLETDPRDAIPMLSVRFRRPFGERGIQTVLRATAVKNELECEPIFATPTHEELTAQREELLRSASDRWQRAASEAQADVPSALDLYFDVTRRDKEIVRVWKLGEVRPVVLGRISELREAAREFPISLWGEGRYLVEIFEEVDLQRIDSFVLDAKEMPELTRLKPQLGSP